MSQRGEQWRIIDRWLVSLMTLAEVEVVWLEGSLVRNRDAVPGADIDMRIAIADSAYDRLWKNDKSQLLVGLGHILRLIDRDWLRALTTEGVIVELSVRKSSELDGLALHDWEILLNRLGDGRPNFVKLPAKTPAETWTETKDCTPEFVHQQMEIAMTVLANAPAPFYNGELQSARFTVDDFRVTLLKLMYRDAGVWFAKRYKHLSEVLSAETLADLAYTYEQDSRAALDPKALAGATLHIYEMIGKYLERLANRYGGGFERQWYDRLHQKTAEKLADVFSN